MDWTTLLAMALTAALVVFLAAALLVPERFS